MLTENTDSLLVVSHDAPRLSIIQVKLSSSPSWCSLSTWLQTVCFFKLSFFFQSKSLITHYSIFKSMSWTFHVLLFVILSKVLNQRTIIIKLRLIVTNFRKKTPRWVSGCFLWEWDVRPLLGFSCYFCRLWPLTCLQVDVVVKQYLLRFYRKVCEPFHAKFLIYSLHNCLAQHNVALSCSQHRFTLCTFFISFCTFSSIQYVYFHLTQKMEQI